MIYFTSDLHLFHDRDFIYGPRGFDTAQEHAEAILKNWNSLISETDDVYVLGDLMLNDDERGIEYLNRLNGNLHIIYGNHDTDSRIKLYHNLDNVVEICGYSTILKYGKKRLYLSHYPSKTWTSEDGFSGAYKKLLNLCGHTHTNDRFLEMRNGVYSYHVELDAHNNFPVSIKEIFEDIRSF